jgi:hypothetical protein
MALENNIWQTLQAMGTSLTAIANALKAGLIISPVPASYTVAALPASASAGQIAWASNGRKAGEGTGLGTGVPVFWNPQTSTWFSYLSGVQVTS